MDRNDARARRLEAERDAARLDAAYDRIDARRELDVGGRQIDDHSVRRVGGDLPFDDERVREELQELLWRTDDEGMNRRRRILEHQRAVELRSELHFDEVLVRLLRRDDEPEDDGEQKSRALERQALGECFGEPSAPVRDGTRARAALVMRSRRAGHCRRQ